MPKHYGLIGKNLDHSFSPSYFKEKFESLRCKDSYKSYPIERIEDLSKLLADNNLSGFNVTIPYKEAILDFLDEIDPAAKQIGAVNTVLIKGNKLMGYNTDYIGFLKSIRPFLAKEHSRALVLGSGGASKAIIYALQQLQIPYYVVSRKANLENQHISYQDLDQENLAQFPLIINCTPLGTFPKIEEFPPIPLSGIQSFHFVYDLIYNPAETVLLQIAKKAGALYSNGLNMLKIQADEAYKIWKKA